MSLKIENAPAKPESIKEILVHFDKDHNFAMDFATEVKNAMGGDPNAPKLVEAYFQPADQELASFGIPPQSNAAIRACTDVGRLIVVKCKEKAPEVFP
jgi:hypothetical protein